MTSFLTFTYAAPANIEKRTTVQGFDISHYQGTINFQSAYDSGARFVIIKVSAQINMKPLARLVVPE